MGSLLNAPFPEQSYHAMRRFFAARFRPLPRSQVALGSERFPEAVLRRVRTHLWVGAWSKHSFAEQGIPKCNLGTSSKKRDAELSAADLPGNVASRTVQEGVCKLKCPRNIVPNAVRRLLPEPRKVCARAVSWRTRRHRLSKTHHDPHRRRSSKLRRRFHNSR